MTLYERRTFTVPASAGDRAYCTEHGHTLPDSQGRCLRCGTAVVVSVRDFGAVGDGAIDDAAAFQHATDSLSKEAS